MHKVVKKLWLPSGPAIHVGAGEGGGDPGEPGFLYQASPALNANDSNPSTSFRVRVPVAINALTEARVTIRPGTTNSLTILHASIGKWGGASIYGDTTTTPIELLFGGVSGFSGATSPKTSDWVNIASLGLLAEDQAVIIYDIAAGGSTASQRLNNASPGVVTSFQTMESWNIANPAGLGFSDLVNQNFAIDSVETR